MGDLLVRGRIIWEEGLLKEIQLLLDTKFSLIWSFLEVL